MSIVLNERCYICNSVSSEEIETSPGDFYEKNGFIRDPRNPIRSLCIACKEVEEELITEYESNDLNYGWLGVYHGWTSGLPSGSDKEIPVEKDEE